ncbi:poly [ADP-ribose] polymerase 1-like isoform X2 [Penaeus japonicus]|uniref:poly [ADP-ribose] polymerase 1-like isoform X2 n=1 Tax=Penaeus japonicus TaxID=27405 RepID=UPI001C7163A1|nr:poly [ADP-ribose] polymerase 1-like isoform X2 [Penaeus japonicus]
MESLDKAIKEYKKSFNSKTRPRRRTEITEFKPDVYTLLEMDEDDEEEGMDTAGTDIPLGKLSQKQIKRGQQALEEIKEAIREEESEDELKKLSSKYYTYIPHSSKRNKVPDLIQNLDHVNEEEKILLDMQKTHLKRENQQGNMDLKSEENTNSQLVEPKMEPKMEQTSENKPNTSDLPKNQIVPEPDTLVAVKKEVEDNEETEEQLGEPELNPRKKQKKENHKE